MKYRKLRIAWSVSWGVVCLLLFFLWVRSLNSWDRYLVRVSKEHSLLWQSTPGAMIFSVILYHSQMEHGKILTSSADDWRDFAKELREWQFRSPIWAGFDYNHGYLTLPYWFLVTVSAVLCVATFNCKWQFSLRTLFLMMTLAAVAFGVLAWAVH